MMNEILKELEDAFRVISSIPVTHDSVDAMAVARTKLRRVYAQLKEMGVESTGEEEANE